MSDRDKAIKMFAKYMPVKYRGVENYRSWSHAMVDTWSKVSPIVSKYLIEGDAAFEDLPPGIRDSVRDGTHDLFREGFVRSSLEAVSGPSFLDRDKWLWTSDEYRTHPIYERSKVWKYAISLHKEMNHREAYLLAILENLLNHELYVIDRLARTPRSISLLEILDILCFWYKAHNFILEVWDPELIDQTFTFVPDNGSRKMYIETAKKYRAVPGLRSCISEMAALDEFLNRRQYASIDDPYPFGINEASTLESESLSPLPNVHSWVVSEKNPQRQKQEPICFNCESAYHTMYQCPEPREQKRIRKNKKKFKTLVKKNKESLQWIPSVFELRDSE